jgi:hypothetical protein
LEPNRQTFEDELQSDIESECGKFGEFKCTIFEKHPEGVVSIKYGEATSAEQCIKAMDGRFFAGRKLVCTYWDGETDYTHKDSQEDEAKRLNEFGDWLEQQSSEDEGDAEDEPVVSGSCYSPCVSSLIVDLLTSCALCFVYTVVYCSAAREDARCQPQSIHA